MAYTTSKAIGDLLKPFVGKTKYQVKNTVDLSKDMSNMHVLDNEIINSHNVGALFMKVPLKQAMSVMRKRLELDNTLRECTNPLATDIMSLLEFVLSTTYFQFNSCFYKQLILRCTDG